jgi:putative ABC transport system substrate-binding protein
MKTGEHHMKLFPSMSFSGNPKSKIEKRSRRPKWLGIFAITFAFVFDGVVATAQQGAKIPRIGVLSLVFSPSAPRFEIFRQGLNDLGWVEGKNVTIEYRYAEGNNLRLPEFAAELVALKVDGILVGGATEALVAKKVTAAIPIVMTFAGDPVGVGLVASLARPGGNVTGLSSLSDELSTKRLELLKEIVPKLSHVAVLWNPEQSSSTRSWKIIQPVAKPLGLKLHSFEARSPQDFDKTFAEVVKAGVGALAIMPGAPFGAATNAKRLSEFVLSSRLPSISNERSFVEAGGLALYAEDRSYNYRRVATYVDKILKGAKPADLPVEQPMKFEFIVNLKTAKQIGLTVPPNVLVRADRVIR